MHEGSSYRWVYRLSSVWPYKLWDTHLFWFENKPYVIESLIDEELDFHMHEGTGASPWTGQYFRTAERRTWLPDKCDILSLICYGHVIVDHLLRSNAVCTRMYSIMEDLRLRLRYFYGLIQPWYPDDKQHKDRISQNLGNLSNEISVLRPYANEWFPPGLQSIKIYITLHTLKWLWAYRYSLYRAAYRFSFKV